jgi:hypothetical protein
MDKNSLSVIRNYEDRHEKFKPYLDRLLLLYGGGQGAGDGKLQVAFHGIDVKPGVLPKLITQLHDSNWFLDSENGCSGSCWDALYLFQSTQSDSPSLFSWNLVTSNISNN